MALRVLHFLDTEQFAGTEQHVLTLCWELKWLGIECGLMCKLSNREFAHEAEAMLGKEAFIEIGNSRQLIGRLSKIVRDWKPEIIHTHNGRTSLMASRLGNNAPKRVFTQHFVQPGHTQYRGMKRLAAMAMHGMVNARTDKIIAVSEAARLAMIEREHLPEEKIVTIWNGIKPPKINADYAGQVLRREGYTTHPLFLTIARLAPEKGYRTLLEAVPLVLEQFPEACFVWIGGGELEQELRQSVKARGLQNSVLLLGYQPHAADFLGCADALILPSDCEPFGLVLVEAMMSGVTVIGTECGGPKEIVAPAVGDISSEKAIGWLVPPKNPPAMANALIECAAYPELSQKIAERGRQRALTQFTAERMAHQTIAVYEELLD